MATLLLLAPIVALGYSLPQLVARSLDDSAQRRAQTVRDRSAARLDEAFRGLVDILDTTASFPEVQQMNRGAGEPLLWRLSAASPYVARMTVVDVDGEVQLDSSALTAAGPPKDNILDRDSLRAVMTRGWPSLEPDFSATGDPTLVVAVPLRDQGQRTMGAVTAQLRTDALAALFADAAQGQNVGIMLVGAGDEPLLTMNLTHSSESQSMYRASNAPIQRAEVLRGSYLTSETALTALPVRLLVVYMANTALVPLGSLPARASMLALLVLTVLVVAAWLSQRLAGPSDLAVAQRSPSSRSGVPAGGRVAIADITALAGTLPEGTISSDRSESQLHQSTALAVRQTEGWGTNARQVQEVQEAERKRIALDLHDTVARQIASALFALEGGPNCATSLPVQQACLTLRRAHTDIHRTIFNNRPPVLGGSGLIGALRGLINAFRSEFKGSVHMSCRGNARRLLPTAEVAVYRAVQEGLRNIAVHSGAQEVGIALAFEPDGMSVTLRDDGKGFDATRIEAMPADHIGILGMRQRIEDLGGTLVVASCRDAGTTLTFLVPAEFYSSDALLVPISHAQPGRG